MSLSTHVLDLVAGAPAAAVPVRLDRRGHEGWIEVARGTTDIDGRWRYGDDPGPGVYRWSFESPGHFFPEIAIVFVKGDEPHLHVPLLLSAFGYSTYKGS